jgi:hypothetical protein
VTDEAGSTERPSAASHGSQGFAYRSYVLAVLVIVYTFNFIDRQIVGILAVPIKSELALTDSQLGLMGGLAFALFYTLLGIPIARLADLFFAVRLLSQPPARPGFERLLVRNPGGQRDWDRSRRIHRPLDELAHGIFHRRCCRAVGGPLAQHGA